MLAIGIGNDARGSATGAGMRVGVGETIAWPVVFTPGVPTTSTRRPDRTTLPLAVIALEELEATVMSPSYCITELPVAVNEPFRVGCKMNAARNTSTVNT